MVIIGGTMAHRQKKYAAQFKQAKIETLTFAGGEGRKAIVAMTTNEQWHKRRAKNVEGFWKPTAIA